MMSYAEQEAWERYLSEKKKSDEAQKFLEKTEAETEKAYKEWEKERQNHYKKYYKSID